ncbi:polyketide cyclase [Nocardioides hwasunensis]|uniref:Polyketide cyclase n=1 Tax=Nocardioides hwasunensis TaxID=397258 RepID=A0ABR8MK85_9ACTN|nr:polyketide cyclase [Nocardioides hwasunensis]MBD3915180.1 polyketide cyclase [Nocardioides hwasunensis]
MTDQLTARRFIEADPSAIFAVLRDPEGHVEIDSSGMLQAADGDPVSAVGDRFTVHMDREALGDLPMGRYDVDVVIDRYRTDLEIGWWIDGTIQPPIGHTYAYLLEAGEVDGRTGTWVTSVYDWSAVTDRWRTIFPVIDQTALRATLGILDRVVRRRGQ